MTAKRAHVISLHLDGLDKYEISARVGLAHETVSNILRQARKSGIQGFRPVVAAAHCPMFDSCRDCTFSHCKFDEFLKVVVV